MYPHKRLSMPRTQLHLEDDELTPAERALIRQLTFLEHKVRPIASRLVDDMSSYGLPAMCFGAGRPGESRVSQRLEKKARGSSTSPRATLVVRTERCPDGVVYCHSSFPV